MEYTSEPTTHTETIWEAIYQAPTASPFHFDDNKLIVERQKISAVLGYDYRIREANGTLVLLTHDAESIKLFVRAYNLALSNVRKASGMTN